MIENRSFRLKELSKLTNLQMNEIINILKQHNYNLSLNPNLKLTEEQVKIIDNYINTSTKSNTIIKNEKISVDNNLIDNIKKFSILNIKEEEKVVNNNSNNTNNNKSKIKNKKDQDYNIENKYNEEKININTKEYENNNEDDDDDILISNNNSNIDNFDYSFEEKISNNPIVNDYNENYVDDSGLFKIYGSIDTNKYKEIKRNRPLSSKNNDKKDKKDKNDKNKNKLKNKDNKDFRDRERERDKDRDREREKDKDREKDKNKEKNKDRFIDEKSKNNKFDKNKSSDNDKSFNKDDKNNNNSKNNSKDFKNDKKSLKSDNFNNSPRRFNNNKKTSEEIKNENRKYQLLKKEKVEKRKNIYETEINKKQKQLTVTEFTSIKDLALLMNKKEEDLQKKCTEFGLKVTLSQSLDRDTILLLTSEYNYEITFAEDEIINKYIDNNIDEDNLKKRIPIVTVMGHVDHGKTSLLDYIRKTNVTKKEAGGITQHIGAYKTKTSKGDDIVFLDTPGHEAFTAMRSRGCDITDIVIIIIAADDGVKPQTIEALNQAKNANIPIIFAINKIDKEGANPDKIKESLSQMNFLVEDWGGKYQCQYISAKTGQGVDELLDKILLEAEMLDLKADYNIKARGTVIESSLEKGRGYINNIIVQNGELKVGDIVVTSNYYGKVKGLIDDNGKNIKNAYPSDPVQIIGINGPSKSGEKFYVVDNEKIAKEIIEEKDKVIKEQKIRLQNIDKTKPVNNYKDKDDRFKKNNIINNKNEDDKDGEKGKDEEKDEKRIVNIIIKTDVYGSAQALSDSLLKLSEENIEINVINSGIGSVTESDILLASTSKSQIITFNVKNQGSILKAAEKDKIKVSSFNIIYDAIDYVKQVIEDIKSEKKVEKYIGKAEIKAIFDISKVGKIAGCVVIEGPIFKKNIVKVVRNDEVIFTGEIKTLKHQKTEMDSIKTFGECGICIKHYEDFQIGDFIEFYELL